jgi:ABC-type nitrate/sulfonate/bicarbonate transport system substrate-binding protein
LLALVLALECVCGSLQAQTPAIVQLKLGTTGLTVGNWPVMIGLKKKIFEQHGVTLELVPAQNARDNVEALIGGSVQFVNSGPDSVILPVEQGANLAAIASEADLAVFRIVGAKGITRIADLRGKQIAVSRTNGPDAVIFRQLLQAARVPSSAYTFVTAGGSANRVAAVAAGGASATMLVPPDDLHALQLGMTDLGFSVGRSKPLLFTVLFVERTWAKNNAAAVVNTLRGLSDAMRWLSDPRNKAEAVQILAEYTHLDPGMAAATYDTCVTRFKMYAGFGKIDATGFQDVLDYLAADGLVGRPSPPLAKYVDESYFNQSKQRPAAPGNQRL